MWLIKCIVRSTGMQTRLHPEGAPADDDSCILSLGGRILSWMIAQ